MTKIETILDLDTYELKQICRGDNDLIEQVFIWQMDEAEKDRYR